MDIRTAIDRATSQLHESVGAMDMLNKVGFVKVMPMHDAPVTLAEGLHDPSAAAPDWVVTFTKSGGEVLARCQSVEEVIDHTQETSD